MNDGDRSFVIRVFACVTAIVFLIMPLAIVWQFSQARLHGLPVDVDKFYTFIREPFLMILIVVTNWISANGKGKE